MRGLVERPAILLVNGDMARIGEDNAQVCMHFIFQMLHRQIRHQIHLPEAKRPRMALIADQAGYLLSRNMVHQIATHRAAVLDVATASSSSASSAPAPVELRRRGDPQKGHQPAAVTVPVPPLRPAGR